MYSKVKKIKSIYKLIAEIKEEIKLGALQTWIRFNKNIMRDNSLIFNCWTIIINYFIKPALY